MKKRNDSISRKIERVIALLLAIILGYCLLTAASIISLSEKDETRPADAAIVLGASVYDNSPSAQKQILPASMQNSRASRLSRYTLKKNRRSQMRTS